MLNGPNGPVGNFSLIEVAELQIGYIMAAGGAHPRRGTVGRSAQPTLPWSSSKRRGAEAAQSTIWATGCRSWYLDDRGVPAAWPWPFRRFRSAMAAPAWEAYELRG